MAIRQHEIIGFIDFILDFIYIQKLIHLSNLNLFNLWFLEMPHVRAWLMKHKRRIVAIWLRQSDLIWRNVRIVSRLSSGLRRIRWIIHLEYVFLLTNASFLFVSFLVSDHLQILNLSLWSWR